MAITRSWEASTAHKLDFEGRAQAPERQREFWLLACASLLVACALALVLAAKTQDFADLGRRLHDRELLNLNSAQNIDEVSAALAVFNRSHLESPRRAPASCERRRSRASSSAAFENQAIASRPHAQ